MVITENVPVKHFETFHSLIKSCNGRYTINPQLLFTTYSVGYTFNEVEDYISFRDQWELYMERFKKPLVEKVTIKFRLISFFRKIFK